MNGLTIEHQIIREVITEVIKHKGKQHQGIIILKEVVPKQEEVIIHPKEEQTEVKVTNLTRTEREIPKIQNHPEAETIIRQTEEIQAEVMMIMILQKEEDRRYEDDLYMRIFYPQELDALLKYNGFIIETKYGDFDCSLFSSNSPKQLVLCKLREV